VDIGSKLGLPRLVPAGGHLLFSAGKKVSKNPVAASATSEVTAGAWLVQPAPANARRKRNGDSLLWLKKRTYRLLV